MAVSGNFNYKPPLPRRSPPLSRLLTRLGVLEVYSLSRRPEKTSGFTSTPTYLFSTTPLILFTRSDYSSDQTTPYELPHSLLYHTHIMPIEVKKICCSEFFFLDRPPFCVSSALHLPRRRRVSGRKDLHHSFITDHTLTTSRCRLRRYVGLITSSPRSDVLWGAGFTPCKVLTL